MGKNKNEVADTPNFFCLNILSFFNKIKGNFTVWIFLTQNCADIFEEEKSKTAKHFKIMAKKACHSMSDDKIQKLDL